MLRLRLPLLFILLFSARLASASAPTWHLPERVTKDDYTAGLVIVKLRTGHANELAPRLSARMAGLFNELRMEKPERLFPHHSSTAGMRTSSGHPLVDLSGIYSVRFDPSAPIEKVINRLLETGAFEYAEPQYIYQLLYVPNDTLAPTQWNLGLIHAFQGWDVQKGDSNIVIGITDTGIDTTHPELTGKIRYNIQDPVNGIDDDNDGYVDNYYGWNVATGTYDVSRNQLHGGFVSGIAAAQTDNVTGIAGVGFKTKFFIVACSPSASQNVIINGDLAIQYAADHGANIINCSWGGFGRSQFTQDMVNYATYNRDALVVAGAGNSNNNAPFYPASYENVLSVAAVDSFDVKWTGSSYGTYVDITAQGDRVQSVWPGGGYGFSGGTSEACPQVTGAAALVKAQFPTLTALQIGERLRVTSDNTDTLAGNAAYVHQMGKGRLNIYRALTEAAKSIRAGSISVADSNDNAFVGTDTLNISAVFTNYLDSIHNGSVTLSCNSSYINILNPVLSLGAMTTLGIDSNRANPFRAVIDPAVPFNERLVFTFTFQDSGYSDWQAFEMTANVDYLTVHENDVALTVTSKGRLGYNDAANTEGIGFTYNDGLSMLFGGSFVVGINDSAVSDATFGASPGVPDNDFVPVEFMHKVVPAVVSDFDATTRFNDSGNPIPVGVDVRHNVYAWGDPADRKYVMCAYTVHNTTASPLTNLYAGIYCDWDVTSATYSNNRCGYDAASRMGYQYYVNNNSLYAGIKLLSPGTPNFYAFDNDGSNGSINVYDGFTSAEKYQTMSSLSRLTAGMTVNGNDASMMFASGPFTLLPGDSLKVSFALLASDSLTDLQSAAQAAQSRYDTLSAGVKPVMLPARFTVYPNPSQNGFTLWMYAPKSENARIRILDMTGREVFSSNEKIQGSVPVEKQMNLSLASGTYLCEITMGDDKMVQKLVVQ